MEWYNHAHALSHRIDRLWCHRVMHKRLTTTEHEVLFMQLSIMMFKTNGLFISKVMTSSFQLVELK